MGVFHVFKIIQMVPNHAKRLKYVINYWMISRLPIFNYSWYFLVNSLVCLYHGYREREMKVAARNEALQLATEELQKRIELKVSCQLVKSE